MNVALSLKTMEDTEPLIDYSKFEDQDDVTPERLAELLCNEPETRPPFSVAVELPVPENATQDQVMQVQVNWLRSFLMRTIDVLYSGMDSFPLHGVDEQGNHHLNQTAIDHINKYLAIIGWKAVVDILPESDGPRVEVRTSFTTADWDARLFGCK